MTLTLAFGLIAVGVGNSQIRDQSAAKLMHLEVARMGALDRLHAKGTSRTRRARRKSLVLSVEGLQRSRELSERHFGCRQAEI